MTNPPSDDASAQPSTAPRTDSEGEAAEAGGSQSTPAEEEKVVQVHTSHGDVGVSELTQPLTASAFVSVQRMEKLVMSQNGQPPFVRLVDAVKLLDYICNGGKMRRRQEMETHHPEVFCSEDVVKNMLGEFAIDLEQQDRDENQKFFQFPGFVALSYAWIAGDGKPPDPDPERVQLKSLSPVLEWWMSERANIILRARSARKHAAEAFVKPEDAPCDPNFALFIDFMALYQPPYADGTDELASFRTALFNMGLLYGHTKTAIWKITNTPSDDEKRHYDRRGWCYLERRLSDLLSPPHCSVDVSAFSTRDSHRDFAALECTASSVFGTVAGVCKTLEELAAQSDQKKYFKRECPFVTLGVMHKAARGALVEAEGFAEEVKKMEFSFPENDVAICSGIYTRAVLPLLQEYVQKLEYTQLQWDAREWELFGRSLRQCWSLHTLIITEMLQGSNAQALFAALEEGSLPALSKLDLAWNENFKDAGCKALAGAFERGALRMLKELNLKRCGVTAKLLEGMGEGALSGLLKLDLDSNQKFGAGGCEALAGAVGRGALGMVEDLNLGSCMVTAVLFEKLGEGAMSALSRLSLYGNISFKDAGCVALAGAVGRGALSGLRELDLGWCAATGTLLEGLGEGALPVLWKLDLCFNKDFGDAGCEALVGAVERGALKVLKELNLSKCGVTAKFLEGLKEGALPTLSKMNMLRNAEFGDVGCEALAGAMGRGALRVLEDVKIYDCEVSGQGLKSLGLAEDTDIGEWLKVSHLARGER